MNIPTKAINSFPYAVSMYIYLGDAHIGSFSSGFQLLLASPKDQFDLSMISSEAVPNFDLFRRPMEPSNSRVCEVVRKQSYCGKVSRCQLVPQRVRLLFSTVCFTIFHWLPKVLLSGVAARKKKGSPDTTWDTESYIICGFLNKKSHNEK